MPPDGAPKKPSYNVKKIEAIAIGTDVQARLFTPAPADVIPWHHHSESTDHYFVLRGALTIETRHPDDRRELKIGERHQIRPRTTHLISNRGAQDCEFLLVQGVGKYDWIKAEGDR
jgi:quercetin dioxygenase-like cupin family protein